MGTALQEKSYVALWNKAVSLSKSARLDAYELATVLVRIRNNKQWLEDKTKDDHDAIDKLDGFAGSCGFSYMELEKMLEYAPQRDQWEKTPLTVLRNNMFAQEIESRRSLKTTRTTRAPDDIVELRRRIAEVEAENKRLKAANRDLLQRLNRIKRDVGL